MQREPRSFDGTDTSRQGGPDQGKVDPHPSAADMRDAVIRARRDIEADYPDHPAATDKALVDTCLDSNERGDGVLFATLCQGKFLYNVTPKDGEWYRWDNHVWKRDIKREAQGACEKVALVYQGQAELLAEEIRDKHITKTVKTDGGTEPHPEAHKIVRQREYKERAKRLRSQNGAAKALYWAPIVDQTMACSESDFDTKPLLLPVKNGVIDLTTGAPINGDPGDLMTRSIDIEYNQHATCPRFEAFIAEITGDKERGTDEMSRFLARTFGYCLTGLTTYQHIWLFTGHGRNGKGVLFNLISKILGDFYHGATKGMILQQRNEPSPANASEHLYALLGKRFVVAAETNEGEKIDAAAVKALTGGDNITCRPLFRSEITFKPTHKLFLHTNHLPTGLTRDFAMMQRLLLVDLPFRYVNDPEAEAKKQPLMADRYKQRDNNLEEKLKEELPGILAWMVNGWLECQAMGGLHPPERVTDAVRAQAKEDDWFLQWLEECCHTHIKQNGQIDESYRTPAAELHKCLSWWWSINRDDRDNRVPQKNSLGRKLTENGYISDTKNNKKPRIGITIKYEIQELIDVWKK